MTGLLIGLTLMLAAGLWLIRLTAPRNTRTLESVEAHPEHLRPGAAREPTGHPVPPLDERSRPIRRDGVSDELLEDGSLILYNGHRQEALTLNGTGALVWECCDGDHDVAAIVEELRELFPGAPGIGGDVRDLLARLAAAGLLAEASWSIPRSPAF
jgi:hypothetical protein